MESKYKSSSGWVPDGPGTRDYFWDSDRILFRKKEHGQNKSVNQMLKQRGIDLSGYVRPKGRADLELFFGPVEDQGKTRKCTAVACVALLEFFQKRYLGSYKDYSEEFLYKVAVKYAGQAGDSSVSFRKTLEAMVLLGVVTKKDYENFIEVANLFWCNLKNVLKKYNVKAEDSLIKYRDHYLDPSPVAFALARNFRALSYFKVLETEGDT